jgi:hypothetical protein
MKDKCFIEWYRSTEHTLRSGIWAEYARTVAFVSNITSKKPKMCVHNS